MKVDSFFKASLFSLVVQHLSPVQLFFSTDDSMAIQDESDPDDPDSGMIRDVDAYLSKHQLSVAQETLLQAVYAAEDLGIVAIPVLSAEQSFQVMDALVQTTENKTHTAALKPEEDKEEGEDFTRFYVDVDDGRLRLWAGCIDSMGMAPTPNFTTENDQQARHIPNLVPFFLRASIKAHSSPDNAASTAVTELTSTSPLSTDSFRHFCLEPEPILPTALATSSPSPSSSIHAPELPVCYHPQRLGPYRLRIIHVERPETRNSADSSSQAGNAKLAESARIFVAIEKTQFYSESDDSNSDDEKQTQGILSHGSQLDLPALPRPLTSLDAKLASTAKSQKDPSKVNFWLSTSHPWTSFMFSSQNISTASSSTASSKPIIQEQTDQLSISLHLTPLHRDAQTWKDAEIQRRLHKEEKRRKKKDKERKKKMKIKKQEQQQQTDLLTPQVAEINQTPDQSNHDISISEEKKEEKVKEADENETTFVTTDRDKKKKKKKSKKSAPVTESESLVSGVDSLYISSSVSSAVTPDVSAAVPTSSEFIIDALQSDVSWPFHIEIHAMRVSAKEEKHITLQSHQTVHDLDEFESAKKYTAFERELRKEAERKHARLCDIHNISASNAQTISTDSTRVLSLDLGDYELVVLRSVGLLCGYVGVASSSVSYKTTPAPVLLSQTPLPSIHIQCQLRRKQVTPPAAPEQIPRPTQSQVKPSLPSVKRPTSTQEMKHHLEHKTQSASQPKSSRQEAVNAAVRASFDALFTFSDDEEDSPDQESSAFNNQSSNHTTSTENATEAVSVSQDVVCTEIEEDLEEDTPVE